MKSFCTIIVVATLAAGPTRAIEPVDKDLIPEARALLDYLESIYGKQALAGINGADNADLVHRASGKQPAIVGFDLSGWNSPPWGTSYTRVVQSTIDKAKAWSAQGGIVTMQLHWIHPSNPDGSAWLARHGRKTASKPFNFTAAFQDGTPEHGQLMRDLKGHADFLQQLADARVPVLWRPLHEIEGGWFWWTDQEQPENSAALWRLMFDYFVHQRKLHNLIWVYNAALRCGKGEDGLANVAMRKRFYPGAQYFDIASIDIYPNSYLGIGRPQEDSYRASFEAMREVAPGKMIALAECEAIPDPDRMAHEGPKWLYCHPWWGEGKRNPADWIRKTYSHDFLITLDELEDFPSANR